MTTKDVIIKWDDPNEIELGHRIYRSDTPMNVNDLPDPIGVVDSNETTFIDNGQEVGITNYYRVGAFIDGYESISEELSVTVELCGQETINAIISTAPFSLLYRVSKDTCYQDANGTIPVLNDGDPVLSIRDITDHNLLLKLNQTSGAYYRESVDGDYVQFDPYRDFYCVLPIPVTYPWIMSAWIDNRDYTSGDNHNYISVANSGSSVDQIAMMGLRNTGGINMNPAIATNIGGYIQVTRETPEKQFSMVSVFDSTSQFTVDASNQVSGTYSRSRPNNATVLSFGALRRSSLTASESHGRIKTLFISNYRPTDSEINELHKFNRC